MAQGMTETKFLTRFVIFKD